MKTWLKMLLMWISSLVVSFGIVYGAGKLITTLNQTAVKGDVITSDWVNAVNSKMNGNSVVYAKGSIYGYCKTEHAPGNASREAGTDRCGKAVYPGICAEHRGSWGITTYCACAEGFTPLQMGATQYTYSLNLAGFVITCLKN